jgi:hypothetical protein
LFIVGTLSGSCAFIRPEYKHWGGTSEELRLAAHAGLIPRRLPTGTDRW